MEKITIFTDGSSLGNPGSGGWGTIVAFHKKGEVFELGGAQSKTTNNRMEMTAALEAFLFIGLQKIEEAEIDIFCDSQYLINGMTKWVYGWRDNNWVTKTKNIVLNKDLWEKLIEVTKDRDIEWHYVEGHAGISGNERVDTIATSFAEGKGIELFNGKSKDYKIDIKNLKPLYAGNAVKKSGKIYSYLSMVDGKIEAHKTWAECEKRVKGQKAKFRKTFSKIEEENLIKEWLNDK